MSMMLAGIVVIFLLLWPIVVAVTYSVRRRNSVAHPFLLFIANVITGYAAMGIVGLLIGLNIHWDNSGVGLLSLIFPFLAPVITTQLIVRAVSSAPKEDH